MKIVKINEKTLSEVLYSLFENVTSQKRVKTQYRTFIIDYEVIYENKTYFFEFDGPTHYTQSKTQVRDQQLSVYCKQSDITLIRIPYFFQLNSQTSFSLMKDYKIYNILKNVDSEYECGFFDKKIVLPGDFNEFGWKLFFSQYSKLANDGMMSQAQSIWNSLEERTETYDEVFGINWEENKTKYEFISNYPT